VPAAFERLGTAGSVRSSAIRIITALTGITDCVYLTDISGSETRLSVASTSRTE